MMKPWKMSGATLLLLAFGLVACGSNQSDGAGAADGADAADEAATEGGQALRIGALYLDSQGFYAGVRAGVQEAADAAGVTIDLIESTSNGDAAAENEQMSRLVSSGVDAIIASAVSVDASVPAFQQAADADIPIICYNTCINDDDAEELVDAYILGDPFEFGRLIGDEAADYFEAEGLDAPRIAITNCEAFEVCITRREGFEEALGARLPDYEIVANQEATTVDEALPVAEQILTANPELDAFWGESGGATLGAVRAVQSRDATGDVVVFGSDITEELAAELTSGEVLLATVDISGRLVGEQAIEAALSVIDGEPVAEDGVIIPADIRVWAGTEDGEEWTETHPDGLP